MQVSALKLGLKDRKIDFGINSVLIRDYNLYIIYMR